MERTVSFYTLGCRLNQAETAVLEQRFKRLGYQVVDYPHPADVVVINTCTVTENGDADTRKIVNKVNRLNAQAKIALVGCQAQVQRENLLQMPGVQWVVGNAMKMALTDILSKTTENTPQVVTPPIPKRSFTIPDSEIDTKHTRANLKIQDGCDSFCSFCEVPYARGRARSRQFDDTLRGARELVEVGYKELVLTGINLGKYRFQQKTITDVISALEKIDGLHRLRISSMEPTTIPDDIVKKMAGDGKLCRYLHVPMQSGSDEILQAMNRNHTVWEFAEFLTFVQKTVPEVCLGTDVIVGFPGETNNHFDETYQLLEKLPLTYFHVFSYSDRNIALSRKLPDKVPAHVIDKRSRQLRELSLRKRRTYLERFIDEEEWVLFEQKKRGYWTGLTDTYIRVKVKSNQHLENEIVPVRLESLDNQALIGRLL